MSKKIVLKVDITAERCKAGAMSVVAKLPGIKSMAVDGEKGTLTVVGDVDVVCLASALRKAKFTAVVVSVGPEVEEKKPEPAKKPDEPKKPETPKPAPPCCCSGPGNACCPRPMPPYPGAAIVCYEEQPDGHCIIL
ncbi:hypothetical protein CFC21_059002 [Triticum aestivum]|uniref:HMA domain-containing protein n=3 Tax=Triticum aestivum TaxID=4565 RepID=A0A9R1GP66_WHEAT|nr:heavy metal-associated isoprenylated plant protein 2-like [Triticum dicoccoides]KAF7050668.1 hypothetical protein CFC21_059002 [Triticum aestivum]